MVKLTRLRHLRELAALTQSELAEKAGLTRAAMGRIETGVVNPRPSTIRRIADALGVRPQDLMDPETVHASR